MKIISILLTLFFMSGCLAATSGNPKVTSNEVSAFKVGETTEDEVIAKLGKPQSRSSDSSGSTVLYYHYSKASGGLAGAIPYVGLFLDRSDHSWTNADFHFGPDGFLKNVITGSGNESTSGPLSINKD